MHIQWRPFVAVALSVSLIAQPLQSVRALDVRAQETTPTPEPTATLPPTDAPTTTPTVSPEPSGSTRVVQKATDTPAAQGVLFVENTGQSDPEVQFEIHGPAGTVFFTQKGIWFSFLEPASKPDVAHAISADIASEREGVNVFLQLSGANPEAKLEGVGKVDTDIRFIKGTDPAEWGQVATAYSGVRYRDIYPGADLVITADSRGWDWSLQVAADSRLRSGAPEWLKDLRLLTDGADSLALTPGDRLMLNTAIGHYDLPLLRVEGLVGVETSEPAVIDHTVTAPIEISSEPTSRLASKGLWAPMPDSPNDLLYSGVMGGSAVEYITSIGLDSNSQMVVVGYTSSTDLPVTAGTFQGGFTDAFVGRLDSTGSTFSTLLYLGGTGIDHVTRAIVSGEALHLIGYTDSTDFPTTVDAYDTSLNGSTDIFITRLSLADFAVTYSTYVGGTGGDQASDLFLEPSGAVVVTGDTSSADFPVTAGAYDTTYSGSGQDAVIFRLNSAGNDLDFATYLAGSSDDQPQRIVSTSGGIFVTGSTVSSDFPVTTGAYDPTFNGGARDIFLSQFNATGTALLWSTYLGSAGYDYVSSLSVDSSGVVTLMGQAGDASFPTTFGPAFAGGNTDAFVAWLSADGSTLSGSRFIGGTGDELISSAVVQSSGQIIAVGQTTSFDFPVTSNGYDTTPNGGTDTFIIRLNASGADLIYGTYLGTDSYDIPLNNAIAEVAEDEILFAGYTTSTSFPVTTGAVNLTGGNSFIARMRVQTVAPSPTETPTPSPTPSATATATPTPTASETPDGTLTPIPTSTPIPTATPTGLWGVFYQFTNGTDGWYHEIAPVNPDDVFDVGAGWQQAPEIGFTWQYLATPRPEPDLGALHGEIDFETECWMMGAPMCTTGQVEDAWHLPNAAVQFGPGSEVRIGQTRANDEIAGVTPPSYYLTVYFVDGGLASFNPNGTVGSQYWYRPIYWMTLHAQLTAHGNFGATPEPRTYHGDTYITEVWLIHAMHVPLDTLNNRSSLTLGDPKNGAGDSRECAFSLCPDTQGTWGDPINTRTGGFSYGWVDLNLPSAGGNLLFERNYASNATALYTDALGYGWTHNHDLRLSFETDADDQSVVYFKAQSANQYRFTVDNSSGSAVYVPDPGVPATLVASGSGYTLTDSKGSVYSFNSAGQLTTWVDPKGITWAYSYDGQDRLQLVSEVNANLAANDRRSLTFAYVGSTQRLSSVQDQAGRTITFGYSANGDLETATDVRGKTWTYQYDDAHHLTKVIDPTGRTQIRTEYDALGRAYRQYDGNDHLIASLDWDANGTPTLTDGEGNVRTHEYYADGTLGEIHAPEAANASQSYDANRRLALSVDANGHGTQFNWTNDGAHLESVTSATGNQTRFGYDATGNITEVVDARGNTTGMAYAGTLLTSSTSNGQTTTFDYTTSADAPQPAGLVKTITDATGRVTAFVYDAYGQVIQKTDPAGVVTQFGYDAAGRVITTTLAAGTTAQVISLSAYDAADNLISTTENYLAGQPQNYLNRHNLVTTYAYDDAGRQTRTTDTLGRSDWLCYDAVGRVTRSVQNASGDGSGGPTTDPCDAAYVASSDPAEDRVTRTVYDGQGNLIAVIDSADRVTRTYYDDLNRPYLVVENLVGIDYLDPGAPVPAWSAAYPDRNIHAWTEYDGAGNVVKTLNNAAEAVVTCYDAANRPVKVIQNPTVADPCVDYTPSGYTDQDVTTRQVYDENSNVIATIDAQGRITRTYYDAANRPEVVIVNLSGQAIEATTPPTYDPAFPDHNVGVRTYYDGAGRPYRTQDLTTLNSERTCFDDGGRVAKTVQNAPSDPCGAGWEPSGLPDADVVTTYSYDAAGRQIAVTAADNLIARTYFDPATGRKFADVANLYGQSIATTTLPTFDPARPDRNVITLYGYDVLGRVISTTVAAGSDQERTDWVCYDALGRQSRTIANAVGSDPCDAGYTPSTAADEDLITSFVYDGLGNRIAIIDPLNKVTRTFYDELNRPVAIVDNLTGQAITAPGVPGWSASAPDENIRAFTRYDRLGRPYEAEANDGMVTRTGYDGVGRAVSEIVHYVAGGPTDDETNLTTLTGYDRAGNPVSRTDAEGIVTRFDYDGLNRLTGVWENYDPPITGQPNEVNVHTVYAYDGHGNRLTIVDGRGKTTTFTYDDLDRLRTEVDALSHTWTYSYSKVGSQTSVIDPLDRTTLFGYDELRRQTDIDYDGPEADVTYVYDALGNRTAMLDVTGTTAFTLDGLSRPITITAPSTGAVGYQYNKVGNRTQLRYPDGRTVAYGYDDVNRLSTVQPQGGPTGWATAATQYTYNAVGQPVSVSLPSGVQTAYAYDGAQRLEGVSHTLGGATLANYAYTLDAVGNRTQVVEQVLSPSQATTHSLAPFGAVGSTAITTGGARTAITAFSGGVARSWFTRALAATTTIPGGIVTTTVDYVYDGLYRLTDADYSDGSSFGYAYDAVGNRLTQTTCSGAGCTPTTVTSTYDDANRLATVNGVSYTWDAAGNLLNDGVRTYTYDGANRLTTLSGAELSQSFAYNGNGDRVSQVTGGVTTTYTLDLNGPLTQVLADGASTYLYGYSRLGEQRAAGWVYHQTDALGSVRQLTTAAGAVTLSRQYDPYGQVRTSAGTGTTTYGFTGEQTDVSGLVYLRARYYAPSHGRFITRDTWPGDPMLSLTLHRWLYVNGNPINLVDPTGHFGIEWDPAWNEPLIATAAGIGTGLVIAAAVGFFCATTAGLGCMLVAGTLAGAGSGFVSTIVADLVGGRPICPEEIMVNTVIGGIGGLATAGLSYLTPSLGHLASLRWGASASPVGRHFIQMGVREGLNALGTGIVSGLSNAGYNVWKRGQVYDSTVYKSGHATDDSREAAMYNPWDIATDFGYGFGIGTVSYAAVRLGTEALRSVLRLPPFQGRRGLITQRRGDATDTAWVQQGFTGLRSQQQPPLFGHHEYSVSAYPELAGDARFIRFLSAFDHFVAHQGNWGKPTHGPWYSPK